MSRSVEPAWGWAVRRDGFDWFYGEGGADAWRIDTGAGNILLSFSASRGGYDADNFTFQPPAILDRAYFWRYQWGTSGPT